MKEVIFISLALIIIIGVSIFIPHYYQSREKKLAMKWYKIGRDIGFECALSSFTHFDRNSTDPELAKKMAELFNQCEKQKLEAKEGLK